MGVEPLQSSPEATPAPAPQEQPVISEPHEPFPLFNQDLDHLEPELQENDLDLLSQIDPNDLK